MKLYNNNDNMMFYNNYNNNIKLYNNDIDNIKWLLQSDFITMIIIWSDIEW